MGVMAMSSDDELTRMLRDASPARTRRDARPDAAALLMRDRIMGVPQRKVSRAVPRVLFSAAAAIVVIAVAAVTIFIPRVPASAITPPPIVFTGGGTVAEMARTAEELLLGSAGPDVPVRSARSVSWGLSVDADEQRWEIVPQVMTLEWNEDLSGRMTVVAGEPYAPEGTAPEPTDVAARAGDVLSAMEFAPGEFGTPVVAPPGETREDMLALLSTFGMPESPTASEVVGAMVGVFEQWTLTNEQHAQMISILVDTGDLTVLGSGTDRVGRPVVGAEMKSMFPGVMDLVLISSETGRIVGVESKRVTPDGIVPSGAVISYRLWDTV